MALVEWWPLGRGSLTWSLMRRLFEECNELAVAAWTYLLSANHHQKVVLKEVLFVISFSSFFFKCILLWSYLSP